MPRRGRGKTRSRPRRPLPLHAIEVVMSNEGRVFEKVSAPVLPIPFVGTSTRRAPPTTRSITVPMESTPRNRLSRMRHPVIIIVDPRIGTGMRQPMSRRREPDDVDLSIGGVEPDLRSALETERFLEEYKKRPGYPFEAEKAQRVLAALGSNAGDHGMPVAESLLEHWRRCVAELHTADLGRTHREVGSRLAREKQD